MTLVLSLLSRHYVLQVTDRLLTRSARDFDPHSNKNVIYYARDAIVAIGYSGLAYLERIPTDKWIAQKLRGRELMDRFAVTMGASSRWLDIGQSVELIRRECEAVFSGLKPSELMTQQFLLVGWQWRRGTTRPIVWGIGNQDDPSLRTFRADSVLPRYWHYDWPPRSYLCSIPHPRPLSSQELGRLTKCLGGTVGSPETSTGTLVNAVRLAARKSPVVGPDCMCILIPPPSSGMVRVHYVPTTLAKARAPSCEASQREVVLPAAFSPWIVGPQVVMAPCVLIGEHRHRLGPFTVYLEGPEAPPGTAVGWGFRSQARPPPPVA